MKKLAKVLGVLSLVLGVVLGSARAWVVGAEEAGEFDGEVVTLGVAGEEEEAVWQFVADKAAEEGIEVKIELFTDYVQPNIALQDGSLDLNAFQHVAFLEEWNEANDGDLVSIGYTYIAPLLAYSDRLDSLDDLEDGDTVAIPNDPTNGGRALLALQLAGVIEVDEAAGYLPTPADITDNPKNIEIEEIDPAHLGTILPDVAAAFINNNFATAAGLGVDEAIFNDAEDLTQLEDEYKNVVACHQDRQDDPVLLKLVELYQSEDTEEKIKEVSEGSEIGAWEKE